MVDKLVTDKQKFCNLPEVHRNLHRSTMYNVWFVNEWKPAEVQCTKFC